MHWNIGITKLSVLSNLIHSVKALPVTPQQVVFVENNKLILKRLWKCKGARIPRAILKNSKPGGFILPGTKTLKV